MKVNFDSDEVKVKSLEINTIKDPITKKAIESVVEVTLIIPNNDVTFEEILDHSVKFDCKVSGFIISEIP